MRKIIAIKGSYSYVKKRILSYCIEHFEDEEIWLVDSLQVFDPYLFSRIDTAQARRLLDSIRIARPFTFYQLKDKIFSFTKIMPKGTVIISSLDFEENEMPTEEKEAHMKAICAVLASLECTLIIGVKESYEKVKNIGEVLLWEEQ